MLFEERREEVKISCVLGVLAFSEKTIDLFASYRVIPRLLLLGQ